MNRILVFLALFLGFLCAPALADTQTKFLNANSVLTVADIAQTCTADAPGAHYALKEADPILGPHPTCLQTTLTLGLLNGALYFLPHNRTFTIGIGTFAGLHAATVISNFVLMAQYKF